ncbi:spore germination protein GerPB [Anoxybacillus kestanbolensis]|uniref:spore germination protein GerPB n=1 Tax=Anoxybacillus kestanbolensis TaxID=227476 RepID=UPI003D26005E
MNFYIQQTISIHQLKIGSLTNSSVLQIGTTGKVQPLATWCTFPSVGKSGRSTYTAALESNRMGSACTQRMTQTANAAARR